MWIWKPGGMGDSSDDEARVSAVNPGQGVVEADRALLQKLAHIEAVDELEDEERRAVRHLTSVEDANDTRMIDPRERFNLLFEFVDSPFISKRFFMQ